MSRSRFNARRLGIGARGSAGRIWDRLESMLTTTALIAAVLAVPASVVTGATTYERSVDTADSIQGPSVAVLQEDAAERDSAGPAAGVAVGPATALVSWRTPDGQWRQERMIVEPGLVEGDEVTVWFDNDGNLTNPPATRGASLAVAIGAAIGELILLEAALLGVYLLVRKLLDQARLHSWGAEWARIEPLWTRRSY